MECCHVSQLLLKAEEGCFINSVKARSKKVPCLIHVNSLLCRAFVQQYNDFFFFNQSQSYNLNASLMFCFANLLSIHIFVPITGCYPKFIAQCYFGTVCPDVEMHIDISKGRFDFSHF